MILSETSQKVKFVADASTYFVSIHFSNLESRSYIECSLILSSISSELVYTSKGFEIPWHDLTKGLTRLRSTLVSDNVEVEFNDRFKRIYNRYIDDIKSYSLTNPVIKLSPEEIKKILKKYHFLRKLTEEQIRDIRKLLLIKHGANFSVPGAGKTTTTLAIYIILKHLHRVDCLLVVSPLNAFISWEDEINEVFGSKPLKSIRLKILGIKNFQLIEKTKPDVILINYEKLRKDIKYLLPFFQKFNVHFVLDESHRIKSGEKNLSFNQIIKISNLASRRDILSGTPMPQSINDLAPQFEFLWSKDPIGEITQFEDESTIKKVNEKIKNFFVRTTKDELGLKSPIIRFKEIKMGSLQTGIYRLLRSETARLLTGMDRYNLENLRRIGKSVVNLLEAATNPMLLGTENEYYPDEILPIPPESSIWQLLNDFSKYEKPTKITYLVERVEEILTQNSTNKIVIWSYFVRNLLLLEKLLSKYNPVLIYGGVPTGEEEEEENREYRIKKFHNDPSCRIMIANPQAGGEGISLHKVCHYAIYLDRNFNAALFLQSIDRIHRLGLEKTIDTYIEILIAKDTIDEVLIERLNRKTRSMAKVLNDSELLKFAYDPFDLESGIGLDADDVNSIYKHLNQK